MLNFLKSPNALKNAIEEAIERILDKAVDFASHSNLKPFYIELLLLIFVTPLFLGIYYFGSTLEIHADEMGSLFGTKFIQLLPIVVLITLNSVTFLSLFKLDFFYKTSITFFICFYYFAATLSGKFNFLNEKLIWLAFLFINLINIFVFILVDKLSLQIKFWLLFSFEILVLYVSQFFVYPWLRNSFMAIQLFRYIFIYSSLFEPSIDIKNQGFERAKRILSSILNPGFLITPVPIRYSKTDSNISDFKSTVRLKIKAVVFLIFTALCIFFALFIDELKFNLLQFADTKIKKNLYLAPLNYLYVFAFSYANINVVICLTWWMGRDIPNAYRLPLLAVSPQDRWRRWNTYFYDWLFRFIYFPIIKSTKSPFVAIMTVFSITTFFHIGGRADFDIYSLKIFERGMEKKYLFFLAHGLAVYLGIRLSTYWVDENKLTGWLGVFFMFTLMSFIHAILL